MNTTFSSRYNSTFPGTAMTFALGILFILLGYYALKKGHTFWSIVLISLGVTSIGGFSITTE